ncbi:MAG: small multi-drug export protein [Coriobacteriia bacterium]|nr:small multi-drug export protein [Coriobacteriia bacterium]
MLLLSAAPISELRGGLPLALSLGFSPATAYVVAVVGNLLPVPLLLFGLSALVPSAGRIPGPLGRAARRYLTWQETRHRTRFAKFGEWALVLFVAIPLPMTGAWTGSLLAVLFGVPWRRALLMLVFGVLLAGVIVLLASLGVIAVL